MRKKARNGVTGKAPRTKASGVWVDSISHFYIDLVVGRSCALFFFR